MNPKTKTQMERRDFLTLSALGSVGLIAGGCNSVTTQNEEVEKETKAVLKLASQEGVTPGETLTEKLDFLEENGFVGIEPWGSNLHERVEEFEKALENRSVKMSAVTAGFSGYLIAEDPGPRQEAMNSMKRILEAAGALGSPGLIIVPAFNNQPSLPHKESRELIVEQLKELGEYALKHNTHILLEPLNRRETYFLRLLADAAAIARDSESKGIGVMGDFWHMTWEETSDMGGIISAGKYLHHMHIASRKRRIMPGEDEGDNYIDGFKALKYIGYQNHLSLECGSEGDKRDTIPAAARLIKEQWAQA
jgi:sugar phosphate isomerase/epimerase